MKIIHAISSLGVKSGGTASSTYELVKGLNKVGVKTDILTLDVNKNEDELVGSDQFIKIIPNDIVLPFGYSKNFQNSLNVVSNYDLLHINGLWLHLNYSVAKNAIKRNAPYVITTHGMLYPQAMSIGRWKKKTVFEMFFRNLLNKADCIHATCIEEMNHIRNLGIKAPIAVVPNLVPKPVFLNEIKRINDKFRIGFLGRLHPIKRVLELIEAWSRVGIKDGELYIIGSGDNYYEQSLKEHVKLLGLDNVIFHGFVTGEEKFKLLAQMSGIVLPSDSENFGMVVPEALMVGTPAIASLGTPWNILETYNCGFWIKNDVESISRAISSFYILPAKTRILMGENGKTLVHQEYSVETVGLKMKDVYNWVLYKTQKPDFIYTI